MLEDKQLIAAQHMIECLATVITNLLSAIPWIGTDFVQFYIISSPIILYTILVSVLKSIGKFKNRQHTLQCSEEEYFLSISKEFLGIFVGFVDGDGHISVAKNGIYFKIKLIIELHKRDSETLEHIFSVLKIGNISYKEKTVTYEINRKHLQTVLFPLLLHHSIHFLTTARQSQYAKAIYVITNNITLYEVLLNSTYSSNKPLNYLSLPF